jgi:glycine oxidase
MPIRAPADSVPLFLLFTRMISTEMPNAIHHVCILGGGVIGLSLALELTQRRQKIVVLDRPVLGNSSTWAAGGILPPMNQRMARDPADQLQGLSCELYPAWIREIEESSEMDVEYFRCGGLHVARTAGELAALQVAPERWTEDGIEFYQVGLDELNVLEPALADCVPEIRLAYFLPAEALIRPPRLLRALRAVCSKRGVVISNVPGNPRLNVASDATWSISAGDGQWKAERICVAAGAWSGQICRDLGVDLSLEPRRGQMVLFSPSELVPLRVVNEGPRYLIPRRDRRVLAGSTVEDAGFDLNTRAKDVARLAQFARELAPGLADVAVEACWAGLRPLSGDGFPFLGALKHLPNAFLATGHFRSGIQMAPATARVMSQLMMGERPEIDLAPFRVDRE